MAWFMANFKNWFYLVFGRLPCLPQAGAGRDFDIWTLDSIWHLDFDI